MNKKINILPHIDYILLALFSFFINYYYSSIGVLPQDTFAYYDTAYRILDGSVPFKDYWTVSGPFIDYFQAIIFYIFGISWKSYIINGSIINSLTTIIFFYTIRNFDQNRSFSLFYAFCFSILANPSMGTPFPDHYSTFLSLIGIFFFLLAIKREKKIFWLLVPVCFFLGFLSKQSPSSYILLVLLVSILIYIKYYKNFTFIKYFLISSTMCLLFLFIFFYFNKIELQQFIYQYILFPKTIAAERIENYQITVNGIFFQFKFIHLFLSLLLIILLTSKKSFKRDYKFLYSIILILLTIVLIFHQIVTKNFIFIFFLLPMLACLIQINIPNSFKYRNLAVIILISLTFLLTLKYHLRFNEERKMLNLENLDLKKKVDAESLHPSLKGLQWITYDYHQEPATEIALIKESMIEIANDKSRKMLLSGYLFFSATLEENLNNPSRWPSLLDASNPDRDNPYYEIYKMFVENLIILKKIETLYSSNDNKADIFEEIFQKNCRKTKEINDFLIKHDIKSCIK
jgi:hypothetical protein